MPRRTAEANKAVLAAWKNEQELVSKGKGTRDWTPEQQKDIMECGKAYDDEGRAFEGQHMKSVEKYPEYQGDPKNIQFLTKKEHLEAHKGSWQNPTNWYYDPLAKRYFDFGESAPIPCKPIPLREPIMVPEKPVGSSNGSPAESPLQEKNENHSPPSPPMRIHSMSSEYASSAVSNTKNPSGIGSITNKLETIAKKTWNIVSQAAKYATKHPIETVLLIGAIATTINEVTASKSENSGGSISDGDIFFSSSSDGYNSKPIVENDYLDSLDCNDITPEDITQKGKRKSPVEHTVNDSGQRYHYKDGTTRFVKKQPYKRGTPTSEE